jgi:ABC-2 type transport system permease protein
MFGTLARTTWRRERHLRWSLAIGMFLMGLLLAGTYQAFGTGLIPQSVVDQFSTLKVFDAFTGSGVNLLEPEGWLGFGYVHPFTLILTVAWIVSVAAAAIAREVEDGTIEFLASRPVDRRIVVGARYAAWLAGMLALFAATYLGTAAGIVLFDALSGFSLAKALYFPVSLMPAALLLGGLAFLISSAVSSRSRVFAVVIGFTVASYFLNFAANLWDPLAPFAPLSLFHYVTPAEWALHGIDWPSAAVMTAIGVALLAAAMVVVDRRDIAR